MVIVMAIIVSIIKFIVITDTVIVISCVEGILNEFNLIPKG